MKSLSDPQDNIKGSNTHVTGVSEEEVIENEAEKYMYIFKQIKVKNINLEIQEFKQTTKQTDPKKTPP